MQAFLIHYTKLRDRLPLALETINRVGLDPIIVSQWDSDALVDDITSHIAPSLWSSRIDHIYDLLIQNAISASTKQPVNLLPPIDYPCHTPKLRPSWLQPRQLSKGEVSVLLKHFYAIASISLGSEDYGIIFEDDVRIEDRNVDYIKELIASHMTKSDYIDLAGGSGLHVAPPSPSNDLSASTYQLVAMHPPRTRTNACYIVSRKMASLIVNTFFPLVFPIDWHIQWILSRVVDIECYWCEPPMIIHGSEAGTVVSWRSNA